jgi:hypothetical protein
MFDKIPFRNKIGKAAINFIFSLNSLHLVGQVNSVEPKGKWRTFFSQATPTHIGAMFYVSVDNYVMTVEDVGNFAALIDDIFYYPNFRHTQIPVKLPDDNMPFDSTTVIYVKNKFIDMIFDSAGNHISSIGLVHNFGKLGIPKGFSSEEEFLSTTTNSQRRKIMSSIDNYWTLPIKKVIISDKIITDFLELVRAGKTNFSFQKLDDGKTTLYNKYPFAWKFTIGGKF